MDGANNPMVLVISVERVNEFNRIRQLNSLSRVIDTKLVAAILTGHFDSSIMESPSSEYKNSSVAINGFCHDQITPPSPTVSFIRF